MTDPVDWPVVGEPFRTTDGRCGTICSALDLDGDETDEPSEATVIVVAWDEGGFSVFEVKDIRRLETH